MSALAEAARKEGLSSNMAKADKSPQVVNKSGTLKMTDDVAATRTRKDISGKAFASPW